MTESLESRRSFLFSTAGIVTSSWLAANWPGIAAAAQHAAHAASVSGSAPLSVLSKAELLDVEGIAAQILPSGATAGAREAHAAYFIDRAFATVFADRRQEFRAGFTDFQRAFHAAQPAAASFAAASSDEQIAFLKTVDRTPFFETMRLLTIIGTFAASKYGGNFEGVGWKAIGFEDQHVFEPPFGYYDRDYPGFVPYTKERAS